MSAPLSQRQRQVVPRWRDFQEALRVGELNPAGTAVTRQEIDDSHLRKARHHWEVARKLGDTRLADLLAADVMGTALALGIPHEASDAAQHVLDGDDAPTLIRQLAERIDTQDRGLQGRLELPTEPGQDAERARQLVAKLRGQLRTNPRNPVRWVELSRAHATLGSTKKAIRAMTVALDSGGHNRFVLRSATRLFVHTGDLDRAFHVISGKGATGDDPWLVASELAVAHVSGHLPSSTRPARRLAADDNFTAFERSELRSAVATLELAAGNDKRARKLFQDSLVGPHENSVAQAEWASERSARVQVSQELLDTPDSYEARARDAAGRGDWEESLEQSLYWQHAEPFSALPAVHATYVASVALEDYTLAVTIAKRGLQANPENVILRNNLAYSLANLNETVAAAYVLNNMRHLVSAPRDRAPFLATAGLVAYRAGRIDEGRALYREAIQVAEATPDSNRLLALAWAHFALEELRVAGTEVDFVIAQARKHGTRYQRPDVLGLLERMETISIS